MPLDDILATLPDNAPAQAIDAEVLRDAVTDIWQGPIIDLALGMTYTLSDTPNATYEGNNFAVNGSSPANGALTAWPGAGIKSDANSFFAGRSLGWRGVDRAGAAITITFDFGHDITVMLGCLEGGWDAPNQVYHPSAAKLERSANGSTWASFGTDLSGMSDDPGSHTNGRWALVWSDVETFRYWRFTVTEAGNPDDDWLMLLACHLFGRDEA